MSVAFRRITATIFIEHNKREDYASSFNLGLCLMSTSFVFSNATGKLPVHTSCIGNEQSPV